MKGSKVLNKAIAAAKRNDACVVTYKAVLLKRRLGYSWAKVWRELFFEDKLWFAWNCCSRSYREVCVVPFARPPRASEILTRDEA